MAVELSTLGGVIKALYEAQADTNPFTDAERTKLANMTGSSPSGATSAHVLLAYKAEDVEISGAPAPILWDKAVYDNASILDTSSGVFTVPNGVKFMRVQASIRYDSMSPATRAAGLAIGGTVPLGASWVEVYDWGGGTTVLKYMSAVIPVTEGQQYTVNVDPGFNGPITMIGGEQGSWFQVELYE